MGCRILPNIESRAPQRTRSLQQAQRAHAAEFEPRIGEIIAAWQNVGMTENAVNTAVTSTSSPAIPAETSAVSPATRAANRPLGTPLGKHPTRVLFLGAGELGKEVAIELMRLGAWVCAADSYAGAPAQQVAHEYRALDMANAAELQALFDEIKPDIIVPEVEAIATDVLAGCCGSGRPGGAERRNRHDLHGPRAPARTGPRRIGACRLHRIVLPARWKSCAPELRKSAIRAWSSR